MICITSPFETKTLAKRRNEWAFQKLIELRLDCDNDTILALIEQTGAACHTGTKSCFFKTIREFNDE